MGEDRGAITGDEGHKGGAIDFPESEPCLERETVFLAEGTGEGVDRGRSSLCIDALSTPTSTQEEIVDPTVHELCLL